MARLVGQLLRGYAAVLFCRHELAGLLILAVTFVQPAVGACGLVSALAARAASRWLGHAEAEQPPEVSNALLVGLAIGAAWSFSPLVASLAAAGGAVAALVTHVLAAWLWRLNRLPAMSAGFVLVTWLFALLARDVPSLVPAVHPLYPGLMPAWLGHFFASLGWFLFTPHPVAGVVMFAALLFTSRYLALLAVAGYAVGVLALVGLGSAVLPDLAGFNFMLAAMAVGGLFAFPDRTSFTWSLFAALLAALLCAALQASLGWLGLPPLAAPFLLASWLVLAGLAVRPVAGAPFLLLDRPALPERSLLAARLARARLAEPGSYPVSVPFFSAWQVSQGIDGEHTHRGPWRHAFDFVVVDESGRSHRGEGRALDDYLAFGAPALAPVAGQVWRCEGGLPDNPPGEFDSRPGRNFGNYVLVRTADAAFVLLAHLRQDSLKVRPGDWVEAGQVIGACGNSGRSGQPHLHLQVQGSDDLGAPTRPLHLRSVLVHQAGMAGAAYGLSVRPATGEVLSGAVCDRAFAEAIHLPVGRTVAFLDAQGARRTLHVDLTLIGQSRLSGAGGASAVFEERSDVLAFYDRQGGSDALLDSWLLALGLTPVAGAAERWADAPPVQFAPLSPLQRLLVGLVRPFGASFCSRYERHADSAGRGWRQTGQHRLRLAPGLVLEVTSEAHIDPVLGCRALIVSNGNRRRAFDLVETGIVGDVGVPGRRAAVEAEGRPVPALRKAA
jgi:urea transporter/murein DD-endopeptidase MepM/ murein hydrolase activator NlpD